MEAMIESVTRQLVGPDGEEFLHTNFARYWDAYDSMILLNDLKGTEIVGWAQKWCRMEKINFADAFRGVLAELDGRRRKSLGLI